MTVNAKFYILNLINYNNKKRLLGYLKNSINYFPNLTNVCFASSTVDRTIVGSIPGRVNKNNSIDSKTG